MKRMLAVAAVVAAVLSAGGARAYFTAQTEFKDNVITAGTVAASVEPTVPPFRQESGGGWITGEYNMLPRSTGTRKPRRHGGRETEIQRLIGRALRAAADMDRLGSRTIYVDCDVLQADGGTRVASITGGYVALALAIGALRANGDLDEDVLLDPIAAVSAGVVDDECFWIWNIQRIAAPRWT